VVDMYDAVQIAEGLTESEALKVWHEEAAKLRDLGEARKGRCVGYRHYGWAGGWAVFVGMQDGEPLGEPPRLRTMPARRKRA
jgi:hypothetical protein